MPLAPYLRNSLNKTNLDVQSPSPQGGPNSFPAYNHDQKYSPNNTYLNQSTAGGNGSGNHSAQSSQISSFGITGTQVNPTKNIFKNETSLDIENPLPTGGPNRANAGAHNIPSGQYTNIGTSGVLLDDNGNVVNTMVHQYLPTNTYRDSFSPGSLPTNI